MPLKYEGTLITEILENKTPSYNIKSFPGHFGKLNMVSVRNTRTGETLAVHKNSELYNQEYIAPVNSGFVIMKDTDGNRKRISKDEKEQYEANGWVYWKTGIKPTNKSNIKRSESLKDVHKGNVHIHKGKTNKFVSKEVAATLFEEGWSKGPYREPSEYMYNAKENKVKFVPIVKQKSFLDDGWIMGHYPKGKK